MFTFYVNADFNYLASLCGYVVEYVTLQDIKIILLCKVDTCKLTLAGSPPIAMSEKVRQRVLVSPCFDSGFKPKPKH